MTDVPEMLAIKIESRDADPLVTVYSDETVLTLPVKKLLRTLIGQTVIETETPVSLTLWHLITPESQETLRRIYDIPLVTNPVLLGTLQSERKDYLFPRRSSQNRRSLLQALPSDLKARVYWMLCHGLLSSDLTASDKSIEQMLCNDEDAPEEDEVHISEWTAPDGHGKIVYMIIIAPVSWVLTIHGYGVWFGEDGIKEPVWYNIDGQVTPCCPDYKSLVDNEEMRYL